MQSAMGARAESWDKLPSMAERYDAMPKRLDAMVEGAIRLLSADIQVSWESDLRDQVQKIIELLDEYAFQFRVWTNDISSHEYLSESGDLICQSLDWRIVLSIISTKANAVADTTNQIFESLWIDAEAILKTLDLVHEIKGKDWTDLLKDLEKKTERIGISMHRLSDVKVKIEEIKSTVTAKDIQHGILNDKYSARGTVLSFDGGGIRSYSSLLILEELMKRIRSIAEDVKPTSDNTKGLSRRAKSLCPADIFEYCFGSSSGGLIAIQLGRLEMQVDDCLNVFPQWAGQIFSKPRHFRRFGLRSPKYKVENLNRAIIQVIGDFNPDLNAPRWKYNEFVKPDAKCKTAVCAYQLEGKIGSTKLIRSYKRPHADENERQISCQIWEAARATSAAPTYFAPTIIDQHSFIDGGFGSNNPSLVGFKEIQSIFRTVAPQEVLPKPLIVSIGSGILKNENISKSSSRTATAKITDIGRSLITDTQKANADLKAIADLQIEYFRFEVESGLEDIAFDTWKVDKQNERVNFVTLETIKQATYEYLSRKEVVEALEECARLLVYRLISKACPGRHHRLEQGTLNVPFSRNPSFVGRASILNHVNELLGTYHQAALVGPPGIGKTQIATEYIYRYRSQYHSIFWLNMSSPEHFEQGLISIATALNLPYKEHSKVSVRQFVYDWLQYSAKDGWMITLDDFEDTNILDYMTDAQSSPREIVSKATPTIRDLFPQHPKGSILLTSRRKNLAMELTENYKSVIEVGAMSAEEGVQLLRENYSDICNDDDSARLTSFFGYLPLAIVAAARYLNQRHQNIGMYLIKIEQEMSELHSEILILGRQNPLDKMYGQILGNLKSRSRGLFFLVSLCSCEAIPEYLLRAFFTHLQLDSAVSGDPNVAFEEDITSLTSNYCIQISDSRDFFSIHRMTQAWVRRYLDSDGSLDRWVRVYSEILPSLFRKFDPRDERRSQLVPHAAAAVDYSLEFGWDLRQISILAIEVADCAEAQKNDRLAQELRLKAEKSKSETFHL